jgi:flagellar motor switch protein FliN/FliY
MTDDFDNSQEQENEEIQQASQHDETPPMTLKEKINKEMKLLFDVPLKISVLLGASQVTIKDLLQLQPGSVIEVDKLAGEPLEVLINDKEVARGEVLVINENYGIRLTDIIDPVENDVIKKNT